MTTQKMDFQEPKLTTKGHQRLKSNTKYVCMFVYMLDKRTCFLNKEFNGLIYFSRFQIMQLGNVYCKPCLRFERCKMCKGPGSLSYQHESPHAAGSEILFCIFIFKRFSFSLFLFSTTGQGTI